ncbi:protein kinase [Nocardia tengchongensis]|uniref:protein kinase domain-containing protein n=1 Tax=Nocardia tengchongensis TaxID=2055889 RepID=UPI00369099D7
MVLVPGAVFAGFTIEALLGSGGMGEVYRARHPRLPRQVAVKVLTDLAARDASFRLRFEREGELAARVNHRDLVTVYDRGIEHGRPWICMEYVPGQDVSAQIRRNGGRVPRPRPPAGPDPPRHQSTRRGRRSRMPPGPNTLHPLGRPGGGEWSRDEAMTQLRNLVESELLPPCEPARITSGTDQPVEPQHTTTVPAPTLGVPATTAVPATVGQNCRVAN